MPNFHFETLGALVTDAKAARKGAVGREARYRGLLDQPSIEDATGALPSADELRGATLWITEVAAEEAATALPAIAQRAKESKEPKHLAVMVTRQLSFDSGYVFRDQPLFPKKTPKVRLYPSLTSTLSSILRPLDQKEFEVIRREKRSDCLRSYFTQCFCLRSIA